MNSLAWVAASVLAFSTAYNQFFVPLLMLSTAERYPALVGSYTLAREVMVFWELVMAATFLVILPGSPSSSSASAT